MVSSETVYKTKKCLVKSGKDNPHPPLPKAPPRRAESVSVLCGEYSSTLRKVRFRSPQGIRPPSARGRPGAGTMCRLARACPSAPWRASYKKRRPAFVGGAADEFQIPKVRESFYQHFLFPYDVEAARQALGGLGGSGVLAQLHPAERVDVHGGIVVACCFADAVPLAIIV